MYNKHVEEQVVNISTRLVMRAEWRDRVKDQCGRW